MLSFVALPFALLVVADDGFGGAPAPSTSGADEECIIKGDDGVWRSCAEALAGKAPADGAGGDDVDGARDMSPEAEALRARMKGLDAAAVAAAARGPEPLAPLAKTKLEEELERARIDLKLPLVALRVDVARAEAEVARLTELGRGGGVREAAEAQLVEARAVLELVEQVALHRLDTCMVTTGRKPIVRNFRMTAGGPQLLTFPEVLQQLPKVDPEGCERITLIDDALVAKVKRKLQLERTLATRNFGYHEVAERKRLEAELAQVTQELARGVPLLRR